MSSLSQTVTSSEISITNSGAGKAGVLEHQQVLPLRGAETHEQQCLPSSENSPENLIRITDIAAPHTGYIRILELNNPATRNAISRALLAELRQGIEAIHNQYEPLTGRELPSKTEGSRSVPTRTLIIASGLDSCFCSGADLKERKGFSTEETNEFLTSLRDTFTALSRLPIPTISAISSFALGGGLELALATHFRVLSSNGIVALPETKLGIIPGAGGTYRLPALIGVARARQMILTGRRVNGVEAHRLGIADYLVDVEQPGVDHPVGENKVLSEEDAQETVAATARHRVLDEAVRLAKEMCEGGPVAVRAAVQALQDAPCENVENAMYQRLLETEDRVEALQAFKEKRKPVFRGI